MLFIAAEVAATALVALTKALLVLTQKVARLLKLQQQAPSLGGILPCRCHPPDERPLTGAAFLGLGHMPGCDFEVGGVKDPVYGQA